MKTKTRTIMAAVAALGVAAPIPAALAKSPRSKIVPASCTGNTTGKLKMKPSNGRMQVEFEIDQNRNGVRWNWKLNRAGTTIRTGSSITHAPSGSFSVRRLIANKPGVDTITMRARRASGEVCTATVSF